MKQLILTQFPWPWLPAFALVIFFAFFTIMLIRVSRKSSKPVFDQAAQLALEEGEKHDER